MTTKSKILDALGKFWTKLKSTYVTNCASTSNNLALAASQGKVLQDQITTLNSKSYTELSHDGTSGYIRLMRCGNLRILCFIDLVPSGTSINLATPLASSDCPDSLYNNVLYSPSSIARAFVRTAGTIGSQHVTAGALYNGEIVWYV